MERRPRGIPVARFRTQEAKTRSRSRVREPDYNEQDPEHDLFTLLEDNIALKEQNKELQHEIENYKKSCSDMQARNDGLTENMTALETAQQGLEAQVKELNAKYTKAQSERNASEKLRQLKSEELNNLAKELELLKGGVESSSSSVSTTALYGSDELKRNLQKLFASQINSNEIESLIDIDASVGVQITAQLVERLVDEFLTLKHTTNSIELQLYEANEKISELLENQHQLTEENDVLRSENTNLTKVAKLLTENMKESVETSKKMESALIKLKQRNNELSAKTNDSIDGLPAPSPSPTTLKVNAEYEQIKSEVEEQTREHSERIVEVQSLVDAAIEKSTNDELKKIELKLEILEEQLRQALARAESAECELEKYKMSETTTPASIPPLPPTPPPPPPPPPPLPVRPLYQGCVPIAASTSALKFNSFNENIAAHDLHKGTGEKIIDTVKQQVQAEAATGLDALVREFKSGRVTLRRNRRKTRTNEALQEMFQVLEISQKQNRSSKICVDMHL